ncbi:MAG: hypothetical protein AAB548_02575 [Patescibacteria group bacterium]
MLLKIVVLILLFVFLAIGTGMVVSAFDKLVLGLSNRGKLAAATILVALLTSLPELSIAVVSGTAGRPEISLANLLGANVANLSMVIGGATIVAGALPVVGNYFRWELAAMFFAGIAPILLLLDGGLSRLDGLILVVIYLIYLRGVVIDGRGGSLAQASAAHKRGILARVKEWHKEKKDGSLLFMFLGIVILVLSAEMIVRLVVQLAPALGISTVVLSLIGVALGTTLPELTLAMAAAAKKEVALIMGNLFGSIVTNATLIVGLLALISPFETERMANYSLVNMAFVVVFGLFWLFTSTKRRLDRFEGVILIGVFLGFVGLELMLTV